MGSWILCVALFLAAPGPAHAAGEADPIYTPAERKKKRADRQQERKQKRDEKKDDRADVRTDRKEDRSRRRADRTSGRVLRRNRPLSARPVRTILIPGATFNTDDGLGIGVLLSIRKFPPEYLDWLHDLEWFGEQQAATDVLADSIEPSRVRIDPEKAGLPRPWVWDLSGNALMYLSPQPSAWGGNLRFSWIPEENAKTEIRLWAQTIGWAWAWYMGLGNEVRTDYRHLDRDVDVGLQWHRYGLRDVAIGAAIDLELTGPLLFSAGLRFDLDAVEVRPGTLLAQHVAADLVRAPPLVFGGSSDLALVVDNRDQRHDPTSGGMARGTFTATVSSVGLAARLTADVRGYQGLGPGAPVVIAGSLTGNLQIGALPFFEVGVLASPSPVPRYITGSRSLRGRQRGRIRGELGLVALGELRFRPPGFPFGKRGRLRLEPVVFADAARVDRWSELGAGPPVHPGVGGGLRAILNEQLVVHVDVGTGPDWIVDEQGLETTVWVVGGYAAIGQYF